MKAPSWNHCRNRQFTVLCEREDKERAFAYAKAVAKRYADSSRTCPRPNLAQEMYACTMSRQYTRLIDCPYVIVPLFKCAGLNAEWTRRRNPVSYTHLDVYKRQVMAFLNRALENSKEK